MVFDHELPLLAWTNAAHGESSPSPNILQVLRFISLWYPFLTSSRAFPKIIDSARDMQVNPRILPITLERLQTTGFQQINPKSSGSLWHGGAPWASRFPATRYCRRFQTPPLQHADWTSTRLFSHWQYPALVSFYLRHKYFFFQFFCRLTMFLKIASVSEKMSENFRPSFWVFGS